MLWRIFYLGPKSNPVDRNKFIWFCIIGNCLPLPDCTCSLLPVRLLNKVGWSKIIVSCSVGKYSYNLWFNETEWESTFVHLILFGTLLREFNIKSTTGKRQLVTLLWKKGIEWTNRYNLITNIFYLLILCFYNKLN